MLTVCLFSGTIKWWTGKVGISLFIYHSWISELELNLLDLHHFQSQTELTSCFAKTLVECLYLVSQCIEESFLKNQFSTN